MVFFSQFVEKQRINHLHNVWHTRVVHTLRGTFLWIHHGLDHRTEYVGIDVLPVQLATLNDYLPCPRSHFWNLNVLWKQATINVWELLHYFWNVPAAERKVHHVERLVEIVRQIAAVVLRISHDGSRKQPFLKYPRVFSEEAEQQSGDEDVQVV